MEKKLKQAIVLKKNHKVMENELIKHCENLIGKFKSPNKIHFLSELPKGPSGKIQDLKFRTKLNEKSFKDRGYRIMWDN
jgi:acyl-coenzyme A synthetase/AMP-(fatty) acid ligase